MGEWLLGEVDTVQMFDAEFCPDPVPPAAAALVYIGGSSCAHAWDAAERARVDHLAKLPCWVPTPGVDDPRMAASALLARLRELSVPGYAELGFHTRVMADLETGREPDAAWLAVFSGRVQRGGYFVCPYMTISTLLAPRTYGPCAGYIIANPTTPPRPHLYEHPNVVGTQYAFDVRTHGGLVDWSVIDTALLGHLWPAAGVLPAPAPPVPVH